VVRSLYACFSFIHLTNFFPSIYSIPPSVCVSILQVRVVVECVKNVCGLSVVEKYEEYLEFNLRKFQLEHTDGGEVSDADNA
jgi:hypothetical protein